METQHHPAVMSTARRVAKLDRVGDHFAACALGCAKSDLEALVRDHGLSAPVAVNGDPGGHYRVREIAAWAASHEGRAALGHIAPIVTITNPKPKGPTMTSRHSFTIANRKPQPSPKIPRLTKREERLAIEDLRRRIRTLDREINGPSKAAASARGSALPPAEKFDLDRKMGLLDGRRECFVNASGTKLVLGGIRAESSRSGEDLAEESAREFERQRSRKGKPETFGLPLPPETPEEAERRRRFVPPPDGGDPEARAHDSEELARKMGLLDGGAPGVRSTATKLTFNHRG